MVFLKEFFKKVDFEKKTADDKKAGNISQDAKVNDIKARYYSKTVLKGHSKRRPKIGFQDRLSLSPIEPMLKKV